MLAKRKRFRVCPVQSKLVKYLKGPRMEPKRYIVWSKKEIDLNDPWQKKWYIRQVLCYGRAEDIAQLNWEEVRSILKEIVLPLPVRRLWEDYFGA